MTLQIGNLTAIGIAQEATLGAFGTTSLWLPSKSIAIEKSPNPILPEVMHNSRGAFTSASEGIQKIAGPLVHPLYPDAGMALLAGAMGHEATSGSSPSAATTLAALSAPGAAGISTTATFVVNDIVQVGTAISGISECRKVTVVTGAGPYAITLDKPLVRGHANGVAVSKVVAPFTHVFNEATHLPSYAIEQNMDGLDIQWGGLVISQWALKVPAGGETDVTVAFEGQQAQVVGSPATPSFPTDVAFMGTGGLLTLDGTPEPTATNFDLTINNAAKAYPTMNGHNYVETVQPGTRKIDMKCSVFFQALTGGAATHGYFDSLVGAETVPANIHLVSGTNEIDFDFPAVTLTKSPIKTPMGSLDMYDLDWQAIDGGPTLTDLIVTLVNGIYAPYITA